MSSKGNASVPPQWSMQEKRFGETLKQNLEILQGTRGDRLDRAVTFRDLLDTGIVRLASGMTSFNGNSSSVAVVNEIPNLIIPPAPTNLQASGAFQNIILNWDLQIYAGHSFVQVFRHTSDVIASATLIAQVSGFTGVYSDAVGSGADFYYWVRAVNQNGVTGPFNSSTGTRGQTAPDVNFLLATLTGAITSSELANSLSTPIGQIPGINTSISTINTNITTINGNITALDNFTGFSSSYSGDSLLTRMGAVETTANGAATSAQLASEQTTRANADTALASDITTLQSSVSTNAAAIQTEQTARANADSALSTDITSLTTNVNNNAAAISAETTARSNADSALAADITSLNTATSNNAAAITAEQTARSNADSALATDITTLQTNSSNNAAAISNEATARANADSALATDITALQTTAGNNAAAISAETTARSNADSALASDITTLNTTVSGNSTSIQTQATSINGLSAQYTVKIDNNGAISGYGLASNAVNGAIVSEFIVNADRFAIMSPGTTLTNASGSHNASVPFIVQSSATVINGVTVPAGVYMTDAFIRNGSIINAKIANAAIDNAKISSLSADKLTAGTVNTSRLNIDSATLTADPVTGALQVNEISANKVTSGTIATSLINLDGSTITSDSSGTIKIKDLGVDTLQIKGNAVTIPSSVTTAASVSVPSSSNQVTVQTLTFTSTGAPLLVFGTVEANPSSGRAHSVTIRIKKNGTTIFTQTKAGATNDPGRNFDFAFSFTDSNTTVGSITLTMTAENNGSSPQASATTSTVFNRSLACLEVKR